MKRESLTTIIFMRHAEATSNTHNINSGLLDSPLTQRGEEQAITRGRQIRRDGFCLNAAYSSVLQRARQTAYGVIEGGKFTIPVIQSDGIQERYFGDKAERELLSRDQFETMVLESTDPCTIGGMTPNQLNKFHLVKGMESDQDVSERMVRALRRIARKHINQTVLVVSHSNAMRTALVQMGFANRTELPSGAIENTGYAILQSTDKGKTFQLVDSKDIHFSKEHKDQSDAYLSFQMRRCR